uniref:DNA2/NAM7 helicase helicase domain-containing protein n=1 Tax=Oryza barthii TaxID=65489 RepID=A0A0D3HHV0_9ORYZ
MESIVSSLSCKHIEHNIKLIKGPQDSGKTKLILAILASIGHTLCCVVYAPSASDIVGILNETKNLNMSHDQYKQFSEKAIVFERTCDLGADFGHMKTLDDSSGNYAIAEKSWYQLFLLEIKATNNQVRKW